MARETRIGIVLMMLLTGVFGFLVYRRWNSQQPTILAAASELREQVEAEASQTTKAAAEPEKVGEDNPPASEPTSKPGDFIPTLAPPREEPENSSAAADSPANPFANPAQLTGTVDEPAKQSWPARNVSEKTVTNSDSPFSADSPSPLDASAPQMGETAASTNPPEPEVAVATKKNPADAPPFEATIPGPNPTPAAKATPPSSDEILPSTPAETPSAAVTGVPTWTPPADLNDEDPQTAKTPAADAPVKIAEDPFKESNPDDPAGLASDGPKPVTLKEDPFASISKPGASQPAAEESPSRWSKSSPFSTLGSAAAKPPSSSIPGTDEPAPEPHPTDVASKAPPTPGQTTPTPAAGTTKIKNYVVKRNDNYWTISQSVYGTPIYAHALAQYNTDLVPKPQDMKPGTKIAAPPIKLLKERYAVLIATGSRAAERSKPRGGFFMTETGRPAYRVEESDTLKGIAQSHLARASRWIQIYEMNRDAISDPESLTPGTVLKLPTDASRVKLVPDNKSREALPN